MMGKDDFDEDHEEYQYSGDQYTRAAGHDVSPMGKVFSKPILMFIGVLIIGVGVFKLKDMMFLKSLTSTLESKVAPVEVDKTAVPTPVVVEEKSEPASVLPVVDGHQKQPPLPLVAGELGDKIKILGKQNEALHQRLLHIQQGLGVMFSEVQNIEQRLQTINTSMQTVVLELERQKAKEIAKLSREQRPIAVEKKATYMVRAIIPGRAWLLRDDGATITVVRGDRVNGYGRVKEIDEQRGIVIMNQGNVFRFKEEV